jgi:hypothetical protein
MPVHYFWVFGFKPGLNSSLFACFKTDIKKEKKASQPPSPVFVAAQFP